METRARQGLLSFTLKSAHREECLTGRVGLPLVDEVYLALGVDRAVRKHLRVKKRDKGLREEQTVAGIAVAIAAGAECMDDFDELQEDKPLARMREQEMPSSEVVRKFLYAFHKDELIEEAKKARPKDVESYIPKESAALAGLGEVNAELVRALVAVCPQMERVTLDQDATVIEAHKKQSLAHYKGGRGYQPTLVYSPELDLVIHDQFRDGNVPAGTKNLEVAQRAFAVLPKGTAQQLFFRGDSACYEEDLLKWLSNPGRKDGPAAAIGFTISADMTEQLQQVCKAVPASDWKMLDDKRPDETVEWSEVEFTPGVWSKEAQPLRYLALCIRKRQGWLFANGGDTKYLAVVTNRQGEGDALVRWHWEKAGTIELVHDVLKNDLAAGVMPCGRFGANAAWLRLNVLTYNLLSALKQLALPDSLKKVRPKRLRFRLFGVPGRLTDHQRQLEVQTGTTPERLQVLIDARQALLRTHSRRAAISGLPTTES